MLADSATGWHREPPKHLAHIMRQGRSIEASWGRGGLAVGGAIGTCQSSCSPQRTCWTPLSPSVSEVWQLQTEADMHSSTGSYLAGRMNLSQSRETDNTVQPRSSDGKGTLIKSVCAYSVCVDKRASLSSPWQITTCVRLKEDLRQRS